jgi:DNA-binding ferritin-like protein (Dps family)
MVRRLSNRKLYSVAIPSPRLEIFELITGEGKRVTEAIGEEIAIKYGEMLAGDANFQFHWGKLAGGI